MVKFSRLFALLAFLCAACAGGGARSPHEVFRVRLNPHGVYTFDGCAEPDREIFREAVQRWTDATGGRVALREGIRGYPIRCADTSPDTYGHTDYALGYLEIDPGRTGDRALHTAMHELGHAFGLNHEDRFPDSLMISYNTDVAEVDAISVRRFCNIWGCP